MNFEEFIEVSHQLLQHWLNWVHQNIQSNNAKVTGNYSFTNIIRVAESPTHYIVELQGAKKYYPSQKVNLEIIRSSQEFTSTTSYFTPGDKIADTAEPAVDFENGGSWSGGYVANNLDADLFAKKFGFTTPLVGINIPKVDVPIQIRPEANFVAFNSIDFIRSVSPRIWLKTVISAFVIQKNVSKKAFTDWILEECNFSLSRRWPVVGMVIGIDSSMEQFAKQLLSLSNQNIKEVDLDRFIQRHDEHFASALGYKQSLSQRKLKWIHRQAIDPYESKPDFLMERVDGYFDILDLKTGGVKLKSLTQGEQARTRFASYTDELIAQLIIYERYFDSQENREWAFKELGVRTKDITLIGIIGNQNNMIRDEVDLVLQRYRHKLIILSYNDVVSIARRRNSTITQNEEVT